MINPQQSKLIVPGMPFSNLSLEDAVHVGLLGGQLRGVLLPLAGQVRERIPPARRRRRLLRLEKE